MTQREEHLRELLTSVCIAGLNFHRNRNKAGAALTHRQAIDQAEAWMKADDAAREAAAAEERRQQAEQPPAPPPPQSAEREADEPRQQWWQRD